MKYCRWLPVVLLMVGWSALLHAQQIPIDWAVRAGGAGADIGASAAYDAAGNVLATGYYVQTATFGGLTVTSSGQEDIYVAKYLANDQVAWVRSAGAPGNNDRGLSVATDPNGDVFVTGIFDGTASFGNSINGGAVVLSTAGGTDVFLAKYRGLDGALLWAVRAGDSFRDQAFAVATDAAGNAYITGNYQQQAFFGSTVLTSVGDFDVFAAKYDGDGNVLWAKSYGGSSLDQPTGLAVNSFGDLYVTGFFGPNSITFGANTYTSFGSVDGFSAKLNAMTGDAEWVRTNGGSDADYNNRIAVDATGIFVVGRFRGQSNFIGANGQNQPLTSLPNSDDAFVVKYNNQGNVAWSRAIGGSGTDIAQAVATDNTGGVFVLGIFQNSLSAAGTTLTSAGNYDIFNVRYDAAGTAVEAQRFGGAARDNVTDARTRATGDLNEPGELLLTGHYQQPSISFSSSEGGNITLDTSAPGGLIDIFITVGDYDAPPCLVSAPVLQVGTIANCSQTVTVLNSNPNAAYRWFWNGSPLLGAPSTPSYTLQAGVAGSLTATATIGNCESQPSTGIMAGFQGIAVDAGADVIVLNGTPVTLSASVSGDANGLTAIWSDGSTGATITVTPTATTTYVANVTNANGCTASDAVTVTVLDEATAMIEPSGAICLAAGGTQLLTASGIGFSNATYQWFLNGQAVDGANASTWLADAAGSYTVQISQGNVSATSDATGITSNPVVNAGADQTIEVGQSATLNASGADTYVWSNGTEGASITVSPSATTTYVVTGTGAGGCTDTDEVTVTVTEGCQGFSLTVLNEGSICAGGNRQLVAYSNFLPLFTSYSWSPADGLSSTTDATVTASPTQTTTYTVTGTLGNCSGTATITVTVNGGPQVAAISANGPTTFCQGSNVTLSVPAGAASYQWMLSGMAIPNATGSSLYVNQPGSYSVRVTASGGCGQFTSATTDVYVFNGLPVPSITPSGSATLLSCSEDGIHFFTTNVPGYQYQWYFNGQPIAGANSATYDAMEAGSYQVEITGGGCVPKRSALTLVSVTQLEPLTVDAGLDANICDGTTYQLNAWGSAGDLTYEWSPAAGLTSTEIANPVASPLTTTSYTVTVTNVWGCSASDVVTVNIVSPPPAPTVHVSGATFSGGAFVAECGNDQVLLSASTGPMYDYQWYVLPIISSAPWLEPIPIPGANYYNYILDFQELDELTDALVGNGTGDWFIENYVFSVAVRTPGCEPVWSNLIDVTRMPFPVADAGDDAYICQGAPSGILGTLLEGEITTSIIYQWSPATGLTTPNLPWTLADPNQTTTYTLRVVNLLTGCESTDEVTVFVAQQPGIPAITGLGPDLLPLPYIDEFGVTFCDSSSVLLSTPDLEGYNYQWYKTTGTVYDQNLLEPIPSAINNTYTATEGGWYSVSIAVPGCITTISLPFIVTAIPAPIARASSSSDHVCYTSGEAVQLFGANTGGSALGFYPNTLLWRWDPPHGVYLTDPADDPDAVLNATGILEGPNTPFNRWVYPQQTTTYTLTITDVVTGCTSSDQVTIEVGVKPVATIVGSGTNLCDGPITLTASASGPAQAAYQWYVSSSDAWLPIHGATAQTYSPSIGGRFAVEVVDLSVQPDICLTTPLECAQCRDLSDPFVVTGVENGATTHDAYEAYNEATGQWEIAHLPLYFCSEDLNGDGWIDNPISLRIRYIFGVSYQWFRNGVAIDEFDAYDNDFTVRLPGDYHVQMTVNHTCRAYTNVCPVLPIPTPEPLLTPMGPIVLCQDQTAELSVAHTPGFVFEWWYLEFGSNEWVEYNCTNFPELDCFAGHYSPSNVALATRPGIYGVYAGPAYSFETCYGFSNTVRVHEPFTLTGLQSTVCSGVALTAEVQKSESWLEDVAAGLVPDISTDDVEYRWYLNGEPIADASAQTDTYRPLVTGEYKIVATNPAWSCPLVDSMLITVINDPFTVQPVTGGDYCHNGSDVWGNAIVKIGGPQLGVEYRVKNYNGVYLTPWVATPADVLDYPFVLEIPVPAELLDNGLNAYIVVARMHDSGCEPVELINRALLAKYAPVVTSQSVLVCGTTVSATTEWGNPFMEDYHQWQRWNAASGNWENIAGATGSSYDLPNEAGRYRVRVEIDNLIGPDCDAYSLPFDVTCCPLPSNFALSLVVGQNTYVLNWQTQPFAQNPEQYPGAYEVQISAYDGQVSTFTPISFGVDPITDPGVGYSNNTATVPANTGNPQILDLAVTVNTSQGQIYEARIRSSCNPFSPWSNEVPGAAIVVFPEIECTASVVTIETENTTPTSVDLTWTSVAGASSYAVEVGLFDGDLGTFETLQAFNTTNTSFVVGGLTPSTTYEFRVGTNCVTSQNPVWSAVVWETTPGSCQAPTNLMAQSTSETSAQITWTGDGSAEDYLVEYAEDADFTENLLSVTTSGDAFVLLTDLEPGELYFARVTPICGGTPGDVSLPLAWMQPGTAPCATPTGLTALVLNETTAQLSWNGSGEAESYRVEFTTDPSFSSGMFEVIVNGDEFVTLTDLTPGEDYYVRVYSICGGVPGQSTQAVMFTLPTVFVCEPIANLTVVTVDFTSILLAWDAAAGATDYEVSYDTDPLFTNPETVYTGGSTSIDLIELVEGTPYFIRVFTICGGGRSESGQETAATTLMPTCDTPQDLAVAVNGNEAAFTWTGVTDATMYVLEYSNDGDNWIQELTDQTAFALTTLAPDIYFARVFAVCSNGLESGFSSVDTFEVQTTGCYAPSNVLVSDLTTTSAVVSWTPSVASGQEFEYYRVRYRPTNCALDACWLYRSTVDNSLTLINLTPGQEYEVQVRKTCGIEDTDYTPSVLFTTNSGALACGNAPQIVLMDLTPADPDGCLDDVTVQWDAITGATQYGVQWRVDAPGQLWSTVTLDAAELSLLIEDLQDGAQYRIRVRSRCGTDPWSPWSNAQVVVIPSCKVGEGSELTESAFSVYPNPNNGLFSVTFNAEVAGTADLRLLDISGSEVYNGTHVVETGSNRIELDVRERIAAGVYVLQLRSDNVVKNTKLVIE